MEQGDKYPSEYESEDKKSENLADYLARLRVNDGTAIGEAVRELSNPEDMAEFFAGYTEAIREHNPTEPDPEGLAKENMIYITGVISNELRHKWEKILPGAADGEESTEGRKDGMSEEAEDNNEFPSEYNSEEKRSELLGSYLERMRANDNSVIDEVARELSSPEDMKEFLAAYAEAIREYNSEEGDPESLAQENMLYISNSISPKLRERWEKAMPDPGAAEEAIEERKKKIRGEIENQ